LNERTLVARVEFAPSSVVMGLTRIDRDWRDPICKSETATDFGLSLARVQWDVFTTPTFKGNVPRVNIAYGMAYRWLQAQGVLLPVSKAKKLDERTASSFIHFRFVEYETLARI
jgi:hypothetical protein